jgi:hypothetical protein
MVDNFNCSFREPFIIITRLALPIHTAEKQTFANVSSAVLQHCIMGFMSLSSIDHVDEELWLRGYNFNGMCTAVLLHSYVKRSNLYFIMKTIMDAQIA